MVFLLSHNEQFGLFVQSRRRAEHLSAETFFALRASRQVSRAGGGVSVRGRASRTRGRRQKT